MKSMFSLLWQKITNANRGAFRFSFGSYFLLAVFLTAVSDGVLKRRRENCLLEFS